MADRESVYAWLCGATYRQMYPEDPRWGIVQRLIAEGRAEWTGRMSNRVRARVAPSKRGRACACGTYLAATNTGNACIKCAGRRSTSAPTTKGREP